MRQAIFYSGFVTLLVAGCGDDNSAGTKFANSFAGSGFGGQPLSVATAGSTHVGSGNVSGNGEASAGAGADDATGARGGVTMGGDGDGGQKSGSGGTGSSSGSSSSAGSAGKPTTTPPEPKVNDCTGLGAPGVFEEITPPKVKAEIGTGESGRIKGGPFALAVDPVNQGTIYSGTIYQGFWKSTDCGATWSQVATGTNGEDVNSGMNWTLVVDPIQPQTVYTNSGYSSNGLFKSTDGGVNWTDIWSKTSQPELGKAFQYNFVNVLAMDPSNHLHILLTFHEPCLAPHAATCIAESMDGGSSWKLIDGQPDWNGNEGQVISFLDNSSTWLWGSQTNGFWRTGNSGASWEEIKGMGTSHLQGSQVVQTKSGAFFASASDGIWTSPNGQASTWKLVPDTGPIMGGLVTDGTTMYGSTCYATDFCNPRYLRSPETDGQKWTTMNSPTMSQGGTMGYDKGHKLLYSSALKAGLWRVVVE